MAEDNTGNNTSNLGSPTGASQQPSQQPQQQPKPQRRRTTERRPSPAVRQQQEETTASTGNDQAALPLTYDEEQELEEQGVLMGQTEDEGPSLIEGTKAAVEENWIMFNLPEESTVDPDFTWENNPDLLKELTDGVPDELQDHILDAKSVEDARRRRQEIEETLENQATLSKMGWGGVGLQIGAAMVDPVAMVTGSAAAAPVAGKTAKAIVSARAARAAKRASTAKANQATQALYGPVSKQLSKLPKTADAAVTGAVGSAAPEAILVANKPQGSAEDLLFAAAGGAALGGGMTQAFARSLSPQNRKRYSEAFRKYAKEAEELRTIQGLRDGNASIYAHPNAEDAGRAAARAASAAQPTGIKSTPDPTDEEVQELLSEDNAVLEHPPATDKSAFRSLRFDLSARLDDSPHPEVRALARAAVQDAAGRTDEAGNVAVSPQAASEWQQRIQRSLEAQLFTKYNSIWRKVRKNDGVDFWKADQKKGEFNSQITRAIRSDNEYQRARPEVREAADIFREHFDELRNLAQNPGRYEGTTMKGPEGFQEVPRNPNYVPRIPDYKRLTEMRERIGDHGLETLFKTAILRANPELAEETNMVNRMAKGLRRGYLRPEFSKDIGKVNGLNADDWEEFRTIMREEAGMDVEHIEGVIDTLTRDQENAGQHPRVRKRTLMAEDAEVRFEDAKGDKVTVRPMDLFQEDIMNLAMMYDRQVTGMIAASRMGFYKESDWDSWLQRIQDETINKYNGSAAKANKDQYYLDYMWRGIRGHPTEDLANPWVQHARRMRNFQFIRVMGQVGFSQLSEIGNILGQESISHAFKNMPAFKSFARSDKVNLDDELLQELEQGFGLGDDILREVQHFQLEEHMVPADPAYENKLWEKVDTAIEKTRFVQSMASGLHPINTFLQRWAGRTVVGQFEKYARRWENGQKVPRSFYNRARYMGMDEKQVERIFKNIRQFSEEQEGWFADRATKLNIKQWPVEDAENLRHGVYKMSQQMIQQNDVGNLHPWMGTTMGKIFLQFRTFMLNSYAKQLLHNVHMRDIRAFQKMQLSMFSAGIAYIAQTKIRAMNKDNKEQYLREKLTKDAIAKAAYERSAWATFFPAAADTAVSAAPGDPEPVFGYRASGLGTSIAGTPVVDTVDKIMKAVGGTTHAITRSDYDFSKEDIQAINGLLPLQNVLGVEQALNALEAPLPERSMVTPTTGSP